MGDLAAEIRALRAELASLRESSSPPVEISVLRAQELLNCSRSRVYELLRAGRLERAPSPGRATLVTYASVLALKRVPALRRRPARAQKPATDSSLALEILRLAV